MHHISLERCACLGSYNYPISPGDSANLTFESSALLARLADGSAFSITYFELASIEVSGPGLSTTGGGFIGGGFGVTGAIEGMAIAAILNGLTTKSKIHTFVSLITNIGELHLHYHGMEPGALRIALAPVYATLRRISPTWREERRAGLELARTEGNLSGSDFERLSQRLTQPAKEVRIPPPEQQHASPPKQQPASPPTVISGPLGRCPNCAATISLHADECPSCMAMFGAHSAWKVVPL